MNGQGFLELHFVDDSDTGHGDLTVDVRNAGFAGRCRLYCHKEDLASFAASILTVREPNSLPVKLKLGLPEESRYPESINIEVRPYDQQLIVIVQVIDTLANYGPLPHSCQTSLMTDYEPIRHFSEAIRGMLNGNSEEAVLKSNYLPAPPLHL